MSSAHSITSRRAILLKTAENVRATLRSPGVCVAVIFANGAEMTGAAGVADIVDNLPMTDRMRMPGGSTGKSVFAATALAVLRDRDISLDSHLADWLGKEAWFPRLANASALTWRHVLRHASGLPDHMGQRGLAEALTAVFAREGPDGWLRPEQALQFSLDLPAIHPPGQGFAYSDTNYVLAGLALEAATGASLYGLAQTHVLTPLGLRSTTPALTRDTDHLAPGHIFEAGAPSIFVAHDGGLSHSPRTEWAGGGFYTSARDLARLGWAYASGRLSGQDPFSPLTRFSWGEGHVGAYGLGLFATRTRLGTSYGHGGYFPGYQSQFAYFPDLGLSVAYQANVSSAFGSYAEISDKRASAAAKRIPDDAELSLVDDPCVALAAAMSNSVS